MKKTPKLYKKHCVRCKKKTEQCLEYLAYYSIYRSRCLTCGRYTYHQPFGYKEAKRERDQNN